MIERVRGYGYVCDSAHLYTTEVKGCVYTTEGVYEKMCDQREMHKIAVLCGRKISEGKI